MKHLARFIALFGLLTPFAALAEPGLAAVKVVNDPDGGQTYSLSIQVLAMMTAIGFLPAALMMMTSFTRIVIVLAILRQALGTMSTPSNQIIIGLSLMLTFFIMVPVFDEVYDTAVQPYLSEELPPQEALARAAEPFRTFMLGQTRDADLATFAEIARAEPVAEPEQIPFSLLLPAFVTSELKTAFQIGFLILIPFLVIDLVVASLLMSMGMMMLSPMIISMPFKIMLFVLIDGWTLIMGTLASSFYV
ncbi:MAG: flagellar type III secretion system pore protein FliP [Gammaproteobacteria bacterium]